MNNNHSSVALCLYCLQRGSKWSRDHIFPDFLGGTRCVTVCKACNEMFGSEFETRAASILHPFYILLNSWGLGVIAEGPRWRNAYTVDGKKWDLTIGSDYPVM